MTALLQGTHAFSSLTKIREGFETLCWCPVQWVRVELKLGMEEKIEVTGQLQGSNCSYSRPKGQERTKLWDRKYKATLPRPSIIGTLTGQNADCQLPSLNYICLAIFEYGFQIFLSYHSLLVFFFVNVWDFMWLCYWEWTGIYDNSNLILKIFILLKFRNNFKLILHYEKLPVF